VKSAASVIDEQRSWLLPLTIAVTGVGLLVLIWGWVRTGIMLGRPMSHEEVEQLAGRTRVLGPGKWFSKARLWGKTAGLQVDPPVEWTFQEMKTAWRAGTWWRDPDMRAKYLITLAGSTAILGLFAIGVVISPRSVKLILAGAMCYALARGMRAYWRA
jgi:hypothetical protein